MRTLKSALLLIALIAVFTSCDKAKQDKFEKMALIQTLPNPIYYDDNCAQADGTKLIAGQHYEVGEVQVSVDGNNLIVKYVAYGKNLFSETHLDVENNANDIPHNNAGNPKIGNFEYSGSHDPMLDEVTYVIDMEKAGLKGVVSIAAHAVVMMDTGKETCLSVAELTALIPEAPVTIDAIPYTKIKSYYDLTLSNAGEFNGTHLAWCIDNNLREVNTGDAMLVSSYSSDDLSEIVRDPEDLDLLNYLMNNYYPETPFPVIQAAIWGLMNGMPFVNHTGGIHLSTEQLTQYQNIVAEVMANGEGFVPAPGEYMVIIVHYGNIDEWQNVFFLYKKCTPVYKDETAWGQGNPLTEFDVPFTPEGGSWATYFGYCTGRP